MTYRTIKQREADSLGLTIAEALHVAELLAAALAASKEMPIAYFC